MSNNMASETKINSNNVHKLQDEFEDNGNYNEIITKFEDLDLKDELMHGVSSMGFHTPSPIQRRAIKPAISGADVIAQGQSGTGKTASFVISVLQNIDTNINQIQSIVMAPTRELAKQIQSVFELIAQRMNLKCHAFIGGTRVETDMKILNDGLHIAVGTPGRIYHMIETGMLKVSTIKVFVLDEADEMLSSGFSTQIYNIFVVLPKNIQVLVYSATYTPEALELTKKFMKNPATITVKAEKLTLEGIKQYFILCQDEQQKINSIFDLHASLDTSQVVIFANNPKNVEAVANVLLENSYSVNYIHSKLEQSEREKIMKQFRSNEIKILVATDLVARGIDIQNVTMVFNFEMPMNLQTYLHRIGRSGRFGRTGRAINLIFDHQIETIRELEKHYHTSIPAFTEEDAEN